MEVAAAARAHGQKFERERGTEDENKHSFQTCTLGLKRSMCIENSRPRAGYNCTRSHRRLLVHISSSWRVLRATPTTTSTTPLA